MSWISMKIGLPNTAAIFALALVPLVAVISDAATISGSATPGKRTSPSNTMLVAEGADTENNLLQ